MFNSLVDSAKNAINSAEADYMGKKWLAEVKDDSGKWKDLDGWKETYEPKPKVEEKPDEKPDPQMEAFTAQVSNAALDMAFAEINKSITFDLMSMMLEVSSMVLATTLDWMHKYIDKNGKKESHPSLTILPALNAVILSYRFDKTGKGKSNKFAFIRKAACSDLTDIVYDLYATDKTPEELTREIMESAGPSGKNEVRALLMDKIDEIMDAAGTRMAAEMGDDGAAEAVQQAKSFIGQGENNFFAQFLSFMLVSKLEFVDSYLKKSIEDYLKEVDSEMKTAGGDKKPKEEVQKCMFEYVEKEFHTSRDMVEVEVKKYTSMCKAAINGGPGVVVEEQQQKTDG